jgi:biotin operon repressor
MARIARQLHGLVGSGEESHTVEVPNHALPLPEDYQAPLFDTMTAFDLKPPGPAMRLVLACATGEIEELQVMVDEEYRKPRRSKVDGGAKAVGGVNLYRCLAGIVKTQLPANANISVADATATVALVEAALDRPVTDITPAGKLALHHPVLQVLQDVKIGTRPRKAAAILRGILHDLPQYRKVGVITHRRLASKLKELIGATYAERLKRVEYFGGGFSRGANVWFKECQCLIVLGTPRVPTQAIRAQLQRLRRYKASLLAREEAKAAWQWDYWSGITESGRRVTVPVKHYLDHDWHMAHHSLVIAELVQAIGRARSILPEGIPCYVVTKENLSPLERGIEGHEDYRISDRPFGPLSETQVKVLQALAGHGQTPVSGSVIAREVGLTRQAVVKNLNSLKEAGRVRLVSKNKGWQEV